MTVGKEFAILFGVLFLPGLISQFGGVEGAQFESVYLNIQLLAVSVPQIALVIAFSDLRKPGSRVALGARPPEWKDLIYAAISYLVLLLTGIGASVLATLVAPLDEFLPRGVQWQFTRYEILPLVILSTFAAAYREEIFYRAYLFDRGAEIEASPRTILVGSALLFSIGHAYQGVSGLVITFLLGFVLGALYMRFKRLHAVGIAHGLYNVTMLLLTGFIEV
jgi:membrane protease YdiL (CAAX protease family)